jgi:hypothetical protein
MNVLMGVLKSMNVLPSFLSGDMQESKVLKAMNVLTSSFKKHAKLACQKLHYFITTALIKPRTHTTLYDYSLTHVKSLANSHSWTSPMSEKISFLFQYLNLPRENGIYQGYTWIYFVWFMKLEFGQFQAAMEHRYKT